LERRNPMKISRIFALAAIALLLVGAMGAISMKVYAQTSTPPAQTQEQITSQSNQEGTEVKSATDTDNVNEQVGDQNGPDTEQQGQEEKSSDGKDEAPAGTPAITAQAAQQAAESYLNVGTASQVQLDDENGKLVYSVQFSNGTDVKVDAMTGSVLGAETGENN
ncbi:MAG: PepSY domain-containing protein, partial [Anaerolineae bacterium]